MSTHSVYVYSLFYSAVGIELLKEQHYCGAFIKATIKPPPQPQISRGGVFFTGEEANGTPSVAATTRQL